MPNNSAVPSVCGIVVKTQLTKNKQYALDQKYLFCLGYFLKALSGQASLRQRERHIFSSSQIPALGDVPKLRHLVPKPTGMRGVHM